MNNRLPMTREGHQKLIQDFNRMKRDDMREVINNLKDARDKGDISENAEYEAAKEAFEILQKKISVLSEKLSNYVIIDKCDVNTDSVKLLTTVRLENISSKLEQTYTIVPETEVNLREGKISFASPIGKGLINKKVGEIAKINIPAGQIEFRILEIYI